MQGQLFPRDGTAPVAMTIHAFVRAASVRGLWRGEPMSLHGSVTITDRQDTTAASGCITVDLLGCRRIVYDLNWRNDEGHLGRFYGWKSLGVDRVVQRWTQLDGQVIQAGELLGQAQLRFSLSSLPKFLASLRPA